MSVRPARAKAHGPGQSEAAPLVIRIPSCVSRPVRAKAFIYVFSHEWLSVRRTVLWSGIVGNGPGMVRKIIPEKFLYITAIVR